jgi:hypothetical protein
MGSLMHVRVDIDVSSAHTTRQDGEVVGLKPGGLPFFAALRRRKPRVP